MKRFDPLLPLRRLVNRLQLKAYIFLHKSRKKPYFLYEEHAPRKRPRGLHARSRTFFVALALLTVVAFIIPLRPTWSEQERRELTPFPTAAPETLLSGEFFDQINTWFADTFPFRDVFLSVEHRVESLYGIQSVTITGTVSQGDAIPTAPLNRPDEEDEEPLEEEDELAVDEQTADAPSAVTEPETAGEETPAEPESETDTPADAPEAPEGEDAAAVEPEEDTKEPADAPSEDGPDEDTPAEEETEPEPEEEPEEEIVVPELDDDAVIEQLSAVLAIDNAAYEYYNFVLSYADEYVAAINKAGKALDGISNVYNMIVPNSMGICVPEDVQKSANTSNQKDAIDYMYGSLSSKVTSVPVYHTLLKHYVDGEYLYFRTDHHWTALGAYRAYEQFAKKAGFEATPLESFTAHKYEGFLGTFYNSTQSKAMEETPDTVYAYESPATNNIHITTTELNDWLYLIIGNVDNASASNKYGTFIGGDNPFSYIKNPNLEDGSAVLLVKESYGNAFAPFLIDNYEYVYIVDYRYFNKVDNRHIKKLCQDLEIDDVLFLNTISTTRSAKLIEKLAGFIG